MATGDVSVIILDGGSAITVPGATVQVVIGTSEKGTVNTCVATQNPNTLQAFFGAGQLPEAAALSCLQGGTVIAIRAATVGAGSQSAVTKVGTGTSVVTTTGTSLDDLYVIFKVVTGATIGVAGATYQVSLDAGRIYGPVFALGTANTLALTGTGVSLAFGAGTLVAGDTYQFRGNAPTTDTAGVIAALNALAASQFVASGWGSLHITGIWTGANAQTINNTLETLANGFIYTVVMLSARDASPAAAWGGTGETEATWIAALATDYSAESAKRLCANAGWYNMPSAFNSPFGGNPRYRRPLSWALAARHVTIPPQRHEGRVSDGALANIVIDPTLDPSDGFIYHDERQNAGLTVARFCAARTRIKLTGFFIDSPKLMSPIGSVFTILPLRDVMDIACSIVQQTGQQDINSDILVNDNGTIRDDEAKGLEANFRNAININMTSLGMISGSVTSVDRSNNVLAQSQVNVNVTITPKGYILSEVITIGFANPLAAPTA